MVHPKLGVEHVAPHGGNDVFRNVYNPNGSSLFVATFTPIGYSRPITQRLQSILPPIEAHGGSGHDELWGGPNGDWLYGSDWWDTRDSIFSAWVS